MFLDILGWIYIAGLVVVNLMYLRAHLAKSYETLWCAIHIVLPIALWFQLVKGILAITIADWFTVVTSAFCLVLGYMTYNIYKYRILPNYEKYRKVSEKEKNDLEQAKIISELHQTYGVVDDKH